MNMRIEKLSEDCTKYDCFETIDDFQDMIAQKAKEGFEYKGRKGIDRHYENKETNQYMRVRSDCFDGRIVIVTKK